MDSREVVAMITGGVAHAFILNSEESPENATVDNFVIGMAGGALGGMLLTYYMPGWGSLGAVAAGMAGMVAFDYFLFGM